MLGNNNENTSMFNDSPSFFVPFTILMSNDNNAYNNFSENNFIHRAMKFSFLGFLLRIVE